MCCYFPRKSSANYASELSDTIGITESVITDHPGYQMCILGDLNFVCDKNDCGYEKFRNFTSLHNLVCCDDLISNSVLYSYHRDTLGRYSLIDHVFTVYEWKRRICKYEMLDNCLNTSDHLSIYFCLDIGDLFIGI
jgi:hypothetical protein